MKSRELKQNSIASDLAGMLDKLGKEKESTVFVAVPKSLKRDFGIQLKREGVSLKQKIKELMEDYLKQKEQEQHGQSNDKAGKGREGP